MLKFVHSKGAERGVKGGVPVATLCEWKTKEGCARVCAFARDNLMDGGLGKQGILLIVKLSRNQNLPWKQTWWLDGGMSPTTCKSTWCSGELG